MKKKLSLLFIEDRYFGDPELNGTPVTEYQINVIITPHACYF
jgi:hypothetical protein